MGEYNYENATKYKKLRLINDVWKHLIVDEFLKKRTSLFICIKTRMGCVYPRTSLNYQWVMGIGKEYLLFFIKEELDV